jgi:hypothetical protein
MRHSRAVASTTGSTAAGATADDVFPFLPDHG